MNFLKRTLSPFFPYLVLFVIALFSWQISSTPSDKEASVNTASFINSYDNECGDKTYCSEMDDCSEALYYLNNCNLTRLDGDSDGVPCETLCN